MGKIEPRWEKSQQHRGGWKYVTHPKEMAAWQVSHTHTANDNSGLAKHHHLYH